MQRSLATGKNMSANVSRNGRRNSSGNQKKKKNKSRVYLPWYRIPKKEKKKRKKKWRHEAKWVERGIEWKEKKPNAKMKQGKEANSQPSGSIQVVAGGSRWVSKLRLTRVVVAEQATRLGSNVSRTLPTPLSFQGPNAVRRPAE
jgi:hypothetical protein